MLPFIRALTALVLLCFISVTTTAHAAQRSPRPHVLRPSGGEDDSAAIQRAIDLARDGDTIRLGSGVFRIGQPLQITAKRLTLRGNGSWGPRRTEFAGAPSRELVPAERAVGLVTYGAGGGGVLQRMLLRGGENGIVAYGRGRESATAALEIADTVITQTGRGILWSSRTPGCWIRSRA